MLLHLLNLLVLVKPWHRRSLEGVCVVFHQVRVLELIARLVTRGRHLHCEWINWWWWADGNAHDCAVHGVSAHTRWFRWWWHERSWRVLIKALWVGCSAGVVGSILGITTVILRPLFFTSLGFNNVFFIIGQLHIIGVFLVIDILGTSPAHETNNTAAAYADTDANYRVTG